MTRFFIFVCTGNTGTRATPAGCLGAIEYTRYRRSEIPSSGRGRYRYLQGRAEGVGWKKYDFQRNIYGTGRPLLNLHCTYLAKFNICMLTLQVQPPAERGGRGEPQPEQREDALPWLTIHTGNYRVQRLLVPYLYLINPDPGPHWAPLGSGFRV